MCFVESIKIETLRMIREIGCFAIVNAHPYPCNFSILFAFSIVPNCRPSSTYIAPPIALVICKGASSAADPKGVGCLCDTRTKPVTDLQSRKHMQSSLNEVIKKNRYVNFQFRANISTLLDMIEGTQ